MPDELPCHLFPREQYPIVIEALHPDTRAVVWSKKVEAPDGLELVYIPPLARMLGHPVTIRMTFGDGSIKETPPPARPQ